MANITKLIFYLEPREETHHRKLHIVLIERVRDDEQSFSIHIDPIGQIVVICIAFIQKRQSELSIKSEKLK